jgi:menaquinol-cytochrome c reductase iron-sulfur subunit
MLTQPSRGAIQPSGSPAESRRGFLKWISVLGGGFYAALLGVPALRAFLSPLGVEKSKDNWVKVADDIAVIDLGTPTKLDFVQIMNDAWVETREMNSIWVITEDGEKFKAFSGQCTHLGCGYGFDKEKGTFFCPCHHGVFDVKTGAVLGGPPPRQLDELKVEIRDSAIFVNFKKFRLGVEEKLET